MKIIICWDFDETLGYFRPCEFSYLGESIPEDMPAARLKPGIEEILASLSEFTHVVTTAAIGEYASYVLQKYGLARYFTAIIGREHGIFTGFNKDYKLVGDLFGISPENLHSHLVVIGNDKKDTDASYRKIVMIYDREMVDISSRPLLAVIRGLTTKGEGNPYMGFRRYFATSKMENIFERFVELQPDRVKFEIAYWGNYVDNMVHPMVISPRNIV